MTPEPTPVSGSEKGSVASPARTVIVTTAGLTISTALVIPWPPGLAGAAEGEAAAPGVGEATEPVPFERSWLAEEGAR
jgi:hypothetical protein